MSYYKVKGISLKKNENKIMVNCACNNVTPQTYYNNEFMKEEQDFHKKELQLLRAINGGGFVLNDSCYKWLYALEQTNKELYNGKYTWELYEETRQDKENANEILENYYKVFMKYFNEKHTEKYYLYSENYGYVAPKGKNKFMYSDISFNLELDYFKAYHIVQKFKKQNVEMRIVPTREYVPSQEQIKESKERLSILGLNDYKYDLTISKRYNVVGVDTKNYDLMEEINNFENKYNCYVYHIIHTPYSNIGNLYSMLYVSNNKNEWQEDRKMLENNETYSYVYNKTDKFCSEIGLISFKIREDKVLERVY